MARFVEPITTTIMIKPRSDISESLSLSSSKVGKKNTSTQVARYPNLIIKQSILSTHSLYGKVVNKYIKLSTWPKVNQES